ncbi:MAG: hypothetical protein WC998_05260 [Candidatus Paceibacterota bacterium]|jgi:hypothetical protein
MTVELPSIPLQFASRLAIFGIVMIIAWSAFFMVLFPGPESMARLTAFLFLLSIYYLMWLQEVGGIMNIFNLVLPLPTILLAFMIIGSFRLDLIESAIKISWAIIISLTGFFSLLPLMSGKVE